MAKTNTSLREGVRKVFLSILIQSFANDAVEILIASWRKGTLFNYSLYMSKWFKFASCSKVSPVEPAVQVTPDFLTPLVRQGKSFNKNCMVRSELLSRINQKQNISVGNTSIVKRCMKGMFENNPTLLKFQFTCYVSLLFNSTICRRSR